MTPVVRGHFRDRKKLGTIAQGDSTKRIQQQIMISVAKGNFIDRNKTELVFTRQKARAGENPQSPPRTQPDINIREVRTPSWTLFTQKQNKLFLQQVVQYSQEKKGEDYHHRVIFYGS